LRTDCDEAIGFALLYSTYGMQCRLWKEACAEANFWSDFIRRKHRLCGVPRCLRSAAPLVAVIRICRQSAV